jgi:signal transduction histidine kinase
LAAARERNRLARELHDSVSQVIFSLTLTSQATRILLERDPARVPAQIERLKEMTSGALNQLRSLIAELRPNQSQKT